VDMLSTTAPPVPPPPSRPPSSSHQVPGVLGHGSALPQAHTRQTMPNGGRGNAEQDVERMAVENTALREELRHVPEVLQRALRLDQKRLEGHISRLQSEVRTLVADLVAANEATSSAEQRNEAVRAAAVQAATTEALQAARWAKKEALAKASAAVASALEHALSNAKVERDAVLAETKSNQEHALLEVRRLAQSKLDAAMAAAAHGARAAATEDATEIASAHGA